MTKLDRFCTTTTETMKSTEASTKGATSSTEITVITKSAFVWMTETTIMALATVGNKNYKGNYW